MIMMMLTFGIIMGIVGLVKSGEKRAKFASEILDNPVGHAFVLVWLFFGYMFFVGIFLPVIGDLEFFDTDWEVWNVGGLGALACWIISWFWDPTDRSG